MTSRLFEKYKSILINTYKVTPDSFDGEFQDWVIKRGDNDTSKGDFIWSAFNQVLNAYAGVAKSEQELYTKQKEIYYSMFQFLIDDKRDTITIRRLINRCELNIYKAADRDYIFKSEVEVIGTKCCSECDKIDGKKMSIDEAIQLQILPYTDCTRPTGCVCCYSIMTLSGSDNRPIKK